LNIGNEAADDVASKAERMGLCPSGAEMGRARVRAIVAALRDELRREWFLDDSGLDAVERWMNEILASDGVEAEGSE
jgi:hypothetical protein